MSETTSCDSLMTRQASPPLDEDHDLFRTFLHEADEYTLQPLRISSSETCLSPRPVEEQDVENLPEDTTPHSTGPPDIISDWSLELFALVTSAASFTALIILLVRQDGQPLSTWTLPLSLNTVVSLLSVIIKTPLAFAVGTCLGQGKWAWFSKRQGPLSAFVAIEEAGRGPLGSLTLMWKLKFRYWVCFGAGITIGLLAVDPFLQGLVQYKGKMSSVNDSASILRSRGLDVGGLIFGFSDFIELIGGERAWAYCSSGYPDIGLSLAAQVGFLNASVLSLGQPPGVSCKTGNCTWPPFSTLGICSSCVDISSRLEKDEDSVCGRMARTVVRHGLRYGQNKTFVALYGPSKYANEPEEAYGCIDSTGGLRTDLGVSFRPNDTYSFKKWDTLLASFAILHAQEEYWAGQIPWNETRVHATECALQYCIQVYRPTMTSGKMDEGAIPFAWERVSSSWEHGETDPPTIKAIQDTVGNSLAVVNETECYMIPRSDLQLSLLAKGDELQPDMQQTFNITQKSIITMMESLGPEAVRSINSALSTSTNITTTFNNAARMISYQMREANGTSVRGDTQQWVIYIRVRWPLISGPAVLFLAAVLFSGRVVMESRGIRLEMLKSEPLEMLLHGFDSKSREYLRTSRKAGQDVEGKVIRLEEAVEGPELRLKDGPE